MISEGDVGAVRLLSAMKECGRIPLPDLRRQLALLVEEYGMNEVELSKVFVMNRFIFAVPSHVPWARVQVFGAWAGVPTTHDGANLMWPLSERVPGVIELTSHFKGYYGPPYRPLREFDYFSAQFGPRAK
jgi:hypothetical protein